MGFRVHSCIHFRKDFRFAEPSHCKLLGFFFFWMERQEKKLKLTNVFSAIAYVVWVRYASAHCTYERFTTWILSRYYSQLQLLVQSVFISSWSYTISWGCWQKMTICWQMFICLWISSILCDSSIIFANWQITWIFFQIFYTQEKLDFNKYALLLYIPTIYTQHL